MMVDCAKEPERWWCATTEMRFPLANCVLNHLP
jgi:hypothetical protein